MARPAETNTSNRKYPFKYMKLADYTVLDTIEGRHDCPKCNRSRKFFCYNCYVPVGNLEDVIPKVTLPIHIDIIKHKKEIDGKSTAIHAAILANERVQIYTYPDIPEYDKMNGVVLIFPSATSSTVPQLFGRNVRLKTENNFGRPKGHNIGTLIRQRIEEVKDEAQADEACIASPIYNYENLPIKRAVFIDSTWNQCRGIYKDTRIRSIRSVVLQNRMSQFWRHQRGSPRWYLATIEAIHQFLLEVHVNAWGLDPGYRGLDNLEICDGFYETVQWRNKPDIVPDEKTAPYCGQYDNIMYFFANMYDLIHKYYDHNTLKSYRRPI